MPGVNENSCCVPGCTTDGRVHWPVDIAEPMCAQHLALADPTFRVRFEQALSRLARIESFWDDEGKYDQVVASGRYLKLANATGWANEVVEAAWGRLKLDVLKSCSEARSSPLAAPIDQQDEAVAS